jgi:uncharacterized protein (DUF302 family)
MNTVSASQTYVIAEEFDKALKLVRQALAERELSVTTELDITGSLYRGPGKTEKPMRLLLVDSPIFTFEAMALDRAAGVLIPLHVLVSSDGDQTEVIFVEPAALFDRRLPVGAAGPLEQIKTRVRVALESAVARSEEQHRPK